MGVAILGFAQALAVDRIARECFRLLTVALKGAVLTEEPRVAFLFAHLAGPTRHAIALAGCRMTSAIIETVASLRAAFAPSVNLTRSFALES